MHPHQSNMHSSAGQRDADASRAHKNPRSCMRSRRACECVSVCLALEHEGFLERVVVVVIVAVVVVVLYTTCIYSF